MENRRRGVFRALTAYRITGPPRRVEPIRGPPSGRRPARPQVRFLRPCSHRMGGKAQHPSPSVPLPGGEGCLLLPEKECLLLPEKECLLLPEKGCLLLPEKECLLLPEKGCLLLPEKECLLLPEKGCLLLPERECLLLPEKGCLLLPEKVCLLLPEKECLSSLLPPGEGPGMRETCALIAVLPCREPVSWVLACTCDSAKTLPPPSRNAPSDPAPPGRSAGARNAPSGHPREIERPGAIAPGPPRTPGAIAPGPPKGSKPPKCLRPNWPPAHHQHARKTRQQ